MDSNCRQNMLWLLAALLFVFVLHGPLWHTGVGVPSAGDFFAYHIPNRMLQAYELRNLRVPEWTPDLFGGYPILADPQSAFFYPINLLWAALPFSATRETFDGYLLLNLLSLTAAAWYMFRRLNLSGGACTISAIALSGSGWVILHVQHINMIQTLAPALAATGLLCGATFPTRARFAGAAALLACSFLAGHPQTAALALVACGAMTLGAAPISGRLRYGLILLLAVSSAAGLAAFQLMPSAAFLANTSRAHDLALSDAIADSLQINQWPALINPFFGTASPWVFRSEAVYFRTHLQWLGASAPETAVYFGVLPLALALCGALAAPPHRRLALTMTAAGVAGFILSLGRDLPPYKFLFEHLPGFNLMRAPARFSLLPTVAVATLAGIGYDALTHNARKTSKWPTAITLAGGMAAVAAGTNLFLSREVAILVAGSQEVFNSIMGTWTWLAVRSVQFAFLFTGMLLLVTAASLLPKLRRHFLWCALPTVTAIELLAAGWGRSYLLPRAEWSTVAEAAPCLRHPPGGGRTLTPRFEQGFAVNHAMQCKTQVVGGYSPTIPAWVHPWLPHGNLAPAEQQKLYSLWNIEDIIIASHPTLAKFDVNNDTLLPDWGWTRLAPRNTYNWTFNNSTELPPDLHLMWAPAARESTGTFGSVDWISSDGTSGSQVLETIPPADTPAASVASYNRFAPYLPDHNRPLYATRLNAPTHLHLVNIKVAAARDNAGLLLAHLVSTTSTSAQILPAMETAGFRLISTPVPLARHFLMHKPGMRNHLAVVPSASRVSYKKPHYAWDRIMQPHHNPHHTLLLDKRAISEEQRTNHQPAPTTNPTAIPCIQASYERPASNLITADIQTLTPSWLWIKETYSPGWTAKVNGRVRPVYRANYFQMAVPLSPGTNQLQMQYRTPWHRTGIFISLGTLLTLLYLIALIPAKSGGNHNPPLSISQSFKSD